MNENRPGTAPARADTTLGVAVLAPLLVVSSGGCAAIVVGARGEERAAPMPQYMPGLE